MGPSTRCQGGQRCSALTRAGKRCANCTAEQGDGGAWECAVHRGEGLLASADVATRAPQVRSARTAPTSASRATVKAIPRATALARATDTSITFVNGMLKQFPYVSDEDFIEVALLSRTHRTKSFAQLMREREQS